MDSKLFILRAHILSTCLVCGLLAGGLSQAAAQTTLSSVVPNLDATGVPANTTVQFTFSGAMNSAGTFVTFMDQTGGTVTPTTPSWSAGFTVLTCTPITPFPAGKTISWILMGTSTLGTQVGPEMGSFTVASGAADCTNQIPSYTLGKAVMYSQTSAASPALSTNWPYVFVACTTLACSNSAATNVSLTSPGTGSTNLMFTGIPLHFSHAGLAASQGTLDTAYPNGNYTFQVQSSGSTVPFTMGFSSMLVQPAGPRISNYDAAQTVAASQPFVLGWDAFAGGTATDCIYVEIYGSSFKTPGPGEAGALTGTATSVTIPANTLQADRSYQGAITFYHYALETNSAVTLNYRSATTEFNLATYAAAPSITLANPIMSGGVLCFELRSASTQALIIESSTNMLAGTWITLTTTNCTGGSVWVQDTNIVASPSLFYRARLVMP